MDDEDRRGIRMRDGNGPLIKCACEECNCEFATPDGVCYECQKGLHVRDREREILRNKPREIQPEK